MARGRSHFCGYLRSALLLLLGDEPEVRVRPRTCHHADSQGTRLVYYLVFTHGRANKWTCGRASGSIIVLKFQNSATFCIVALVMMLYYMAGACRASRFGVFSEFNQMSCSSFSPFFIRVSSSMQHLARIRAMCDCTEAKGNEVYLSRLTELGRTGGSKLKQPPILHERT